ncbi:endonuclease/exonuclease/phosphatase family protein [Deinococcus cellulosilyticus]|uniref:endonuclease/exonuclease/phosphatase family protein n=1 Tax=Deinococcus cellulosilyticus TaxID=401558 RepID=UPI0011BF77EC|nr:endonuclease/exonuclease/phosphatase family protein [Deinococcus cellulosilyticus]
MRLLLTSLLYLLLVIGIWVLEEYEESHLGITVALTYSPHFFWLIPLFLLMHSAFRKKNWAALDVQALTLIFVMVALMNLRIPTPQECTGHPLALMSYSTHQGQVSAFVLQNILTVHQPEVVLLQDTAPSTSMYISSLKRSGWFTAEHQGLITLSRYPLKKQQGLSSVHALVTDLQLQRRTVRIINVLLPEVRDPLKFQLQARTHQGVLKQILGLASRNTVIAGNFNAVPHGLWVKPLRARYSEAMGLGFGYTYPTFLPVERRDQVWYSGGLCHQKHEVLPERGSDHRAIQVKLSVN